MKHLLNIGVIATLLLLLPAAALATTYTFHDTVLARGEGPVEGYITYDGTSITAWDFTARGHWFREMTDPLDCPYVLCSQLQEATVNSPTSFTFTRNTSPGSARWFYLFLTAPFSGSPVTIDTTRTEVEYFNYGPYGDHYPVTSGVLLPTVPEPQTWVMLALALVFASSRLRRMT